MVYEEIVAACRAAFPELGYMGDVELLVEAQARIEQYRPIPEDALGLRECELIEMLPFIEEYLT